MAKLYFRYGAMNSGKSTALMQVAHNYEEQGMRVFILKPKVDTKGSGDLVSRLGVRRPADLLEPEMDKLRAECKEKGLGHCEEDVLSYALFPQVAEKFLNWRDNPHKEEEAPAPAAAPAKAAPANNGPRTLVVEDMTNGVF